jgi:hypothetical protein
MLKEIIKNIFGSINYLNEKETFSFYEIKYSCKDVKELSQKLNKENFDLLNKNISEYNYKWDLYIEDYNYSLSQDSFSVLELDGEESDCDVIFTLHKEGNKILIVNEVLFYEFIDKTDLETILKVFNQKQFPLSFINNDYELKIGTEDEQEKAFNLSKQCNFRNYSQYPFSPDYFYIKEVENSSNLTNFINSISLVYCLIYIFDSTEIDKNNVKLSISGLKTIKYIIDFKEIEILLLKDYYRIYNWIYSETNKTEDKIGISRNILTSYLKDESIIIDESVFNSILSSNQIYVKGNITKYFEVRNKIIEQIENTIKKVNNSLETFFNNFQKSIFIFISYFLSVFLFKILKQENISTVFNKETSLVGIAFIIMSFVFLIFSHWILSLDKKRIKERYINIKERYKDVLIQDDIDNILKNNSEFNDEINYLNSRICIYTTLWVLTLVFFVVVLFITSDYLQFPW